MERPRLLTAARRALLVAAGAFALLSPATALADTDLFVGLTAEPNYLPLGTSDNTTVRVGVTNTGPDEATNVTLTIGVWKPELAYVAATPSLGTFNPNTGLWDVGNMPSGTAQSLDMTLSDAQSGTATLKAEASSDTSEAVTANNSVSTTVTVLGLVPSPGLIAFPSQAFGSVAPAHTLTIANGAVIPIQVGSVLVPFADFPVSANGCAGASLNPDASCQIAVGFAPTALGDRDAFLTITSGTPQVAPLTVPLIGTGTAVPDAAAPSLKLAGVPGSLTTAKFKKGFTVTVTPSEPAALEVSLDGKARAGALASAFDLQLFGRNLPLAAGTRTVKVKPKAKLVGRVRKKIKVRLLVTGTDAAGNESSASRTIAVRPGR